MQMRKRYLIEGYQVEINPAAYLVEVTPVENGVNEQNIKQLPDWVFQSKHAIWLIPGTAQLIDRALEGERIKEKLMQKLSRRNVEPTSSDLLPGALELIALHSA